MPVLRVPAIALLLSLAACSSTAPADSCSALFGRPVAATGLTDALCASGCACGGTTWTPPIYDAAFVARPVSGWTLDNPFAPLTFDPYASSAAADDRPDTVCAVLATGSAGSTPRSYWLDTYASEAAARAAGASPTHFGRCGVGSGASASEGRGGRRHGVHGPTHVAWAWSGMQAPVGAEPRILPYGFSRIHAGQGLWDFVGR